MLDVAARDAGRSIDKDKSKTTIVGIFSSLYSSYKIQIVNFTLKEHRKFQKAKQLPMSTSLLFNVYHRNTDIYKLLSHLFRL